jgi:hypothetical protein
MACLNGPTPLIDPSTHPTTKFRKSGQKFTEQFGIPACHFIERRLAKIGIHAGIIDVREFDRNMMKKLRAVQQNNATQYHSQYTRSYHHITGQDRSTGTLEYYGIELIREPLGTFANRSG